MAGKWQKPPSAGRGISNAIKSIFGGAGKRAGESMGDALMGGRKTKGPKAKRVKPKRK